MINKNPAFASLAILAFVCFDRTPTDLQLWPLFVKMASVYCGWYGCEIQTSQHRSEPLVSDSILLPLPTICGFNQVFKGVQDFAHPQETPETYGILEESAVGEPVFGGPCRLVGVFCIEGVWTNLAYAFGFSSGSWESYGSILAPRKPGTLTALREAKGIRPLDPNPQQSLPECPQNSRQLRMAPSRTHLDFPHRCLKSQLGATAGQTVPDEPMNPSSQSWRSLKDQE